MRVSVRTKYFEKFTATLFSVTLIGCAGDNFSSSSGSSGLTETQYSCNREAVATCTELELDSSQLIAEHLAECNETSGTWAAAKGCEVTAQLIGSCKYVVSPAETNTVFRYQSPTQAPEDVLSEQCLDLDGTWEN